MKSIYYLLGLALIVITACMMYIVFKGVSLRTEPIIKPSAVDDKLQNVVFGISRRLFPSFKTHDYVLWGIETDISTEEGQIFELLKETHLLQEGQSPTVLSIDHDVTDGDIQKCKKPCWLVVKKDQASDLSQSQIHRRIKNLLGNKYFTITAYEFERKGDVPDQCENQQRLQLYCILPLSIREVRRYFKEESTRYFFMRRYNEIDYFLFLEKPIQ